MGAAQRRGNPNPGCCNDVVGIESWRPISNHEATVPHEYDLAIARTSRSMSACSLGNATESYVVRSITDLLGLW